MSGRYGERDANRIILLEYLEDDDQWVPVEDPTLIRASLVNNSRVGIDGNVFVQNVDNNVLNVQSPSAGGTVSISAESAVPVSGTFFPVTQPVSGTFFPANPTTGAKSSVASSASSVTILAANAARRGATVFNESTQILYLDCTGGTASATSYTTQVPPSTLFEVPLPCYTGLITGIWAAANGNARVTEWT